MSPSAFRGRRCAPLLFALAACAAALPSAAADDDADTRTVRGCARQFDVAQRIDMESFRDYDADAFRAVHARNAVSVFDSGAALYGIDAIMQALSSHFASREAQWSWTEKYRVVDGCKSAYILYETVYAIPRIGYRARAMTGVGYTHNGRQWLAISDQGTKLPPLP